MKQVIQSLKTGEIELIDTPCPNVRAGCVLIRTHVSLISAGTERMLLEFGKSGWIEKIRKQPDKVKMVLEKIKSDGLFATVDAVRSKLEQPIPLGYCNVGEVIAIGSGVTEFQIGNRILSNGAHAEVVCVPRNLCALIPDGVSDIDAVFSVLGAIALQGIRLAKPELGESVAVIGLGLIGLLLVQLLKAQGCRVLGIDVNSEKLALAKQVGAEVVRVAEGEDPLACANRFSRGRGIDAVLIAAASSQHDIMHQAAAMSRKRGRIVLVGVVGLQLSRADFYEKELTFQVSCSYGPGRYDRNYEEQGQDYPVGFVRWTEKRNFEAMLDMMKDRRIDVSFLISHRFDLDAVKTAYALLGDKTQTVLGMVIQYSKDKAKETIENTHRKVLSESPRGISKVGVRIGVIGAGNYASRVLIPAFKKAGAELVCVASDAGLSASLVARKQGFREVTTNVEAVLHHPSIDLIVIATRHDTHTEFVCRALKAGKKVFVEKPLAINEEQLLQIRAVYEGLIAGKNHPFLMVGFNRRFAPHIQKMKSLLDTVLEPKAFIYTVNAGMIPGDHWTQDANIGGGRIIGEACHMIDLLRFLVGSPIKMMQSTVILSSPERWRLSDNITMTLRFANGSVGTIHYLSNGHKAFPKERLEVFCGGKILQLDNFRKMRGYGWKGFNSMNLWKQDKGQNACIGSIIQALRLKQDVPIQYEELIEIANRALYLSKT